MEPIVLRDWATVLPPIAGLATGVVGILKYFNYRTKKDRITAVGAAFETVIEALACDDEVKRLAAAIRLRRFFDPKSELGRDGLPYARDAINVIAAVLRQQRRGNFQKILADGLGKTPPGLLHRADLQRTNLQDAYLGEDGDGRGLDVSKADFFRADLSAASFKGAFAPGAVFYEARLVGTVFTRAVLHETNFRDAELAGAKFSRAKLAGADFKGARNVPHAIAERLEPDGVYRAGPEDEVLEAVAPPRTAARRIFVSRPSVLTSEQRAIVDRVVHLLADGGCEVVAVTRDDYPAAGMLGEVRRAMGGCEGVVILGLRQLVVAEGTWRAGTTDEAAVRHVSLPTPWNQIEAGIACALGLPMLVVRDRAVKDGVFGLDDDAAGLVGVSVDGAGGIDALVPAVDRWLRGLP